MKAPDVIYVEFSDEVNLAFEKQPFEETPAYIRKDALLEWAKVMYGIYRKRYEGSTCTCGEHWGQMVAFQRMIDKLNSM